MLRKVHHGFALALLIACLWGQSIIVEAAQIYDVPSNSDFKSYMDYETITNENSKQYKLQQQCVTDSNGLRIYNGYFTVAVGTAFNVGVGDYIDVTLDTGAVLHCIVGDMKQNAHVGANRMQVSGNGNVVEFIVDDDKLNRDAKREGTISAIPGFEGDVVTVAVLGGTVAVTDEVYSNDNKPELTVDCEYLIMNKSSIVMSNGEIIYVVEYAFANDFNSIICSKNFYESVVVGEVVTKLE